MLFKIIYIIFYISVVMPSIELLVDWLEYKFHAEIYINSRCSNFREYRKYKKILFGSISDLIFNKNNNSRS